jgi:hypothetical protein
LTLTVPSSDKNWKKCRGNHTVSGKSSYAGLAPELKFLIIEFELINQSGEKINKKTLQVEPCVPVGPAPNLTESDMVEPGCQGDCLIC